MLTQAVKVFRPVQPLLFEHAVRFQAVEIALMEENKGVWLQHGHEAGERLERCRHMLQMARAGKPNDGAGIRRRRVAGRLHISEWERRAIVRVISGV